jgi:hypothetical protein
VNEEVVEVVDEVVNIMVTVEVVHSDYDKFPLVDVDVYVLYVDVYVEVGVDVEVCECCTQLPVETERNTDSPRSLLPHSLPRSLPHSLPRFLPQTPCSAVRI